MAVNTFSMRFGSRRNQRPPHQKMRSMTTVSAMIETIRIGHMIGPPLRKLSMKKLPVTAGPVEAAAGLAEAAADGAGERLPLNVAVTLAPGTAGPPGTPGAPDAPGAGFGFIPPGGGGFAGIPGAGLGFVIPPGAGLAGIPGAPGAGLAGAIDGA